VNLFSSQNLFTAPATNPPVAFGIMTGAFAAIFLISVIAYWQRSRLARNNAILRRLIRRAAKAGMWTAGIALFLAAMRYLQVDYIDMPIWIYLDVLVMIFIVGYFVYDRSENYPLMMWRLQESHAQRQYRPAPRPRSEPHRARPVRARGKRRR
jgi:hypothetical protein